MALIRAERGGLDMTTTALMICWGLKTRCYVEGCNRNASTICTDYPQGAFCLCEEHFQQGNVPGGTTLTIVIEEGSDARPISA